MWKTESFVAVQSSGRKIDIKSIMQKYLISFFAKMNGGNHFWTLSLPDWIVVRRYDVTWLM